MDFYFDETKRNVPRVYLGSQFMGHGAVDDIMLDFKKAHKDLYIVNNLVQLSMDGPNVNWAVLDSLEEYRKSPNQSAPDLVNIGSCGLHVLHGAYNAGHKETDWEVEKNLKAAWGIFKTSPARRSDYLSDNGIEERYDDKPTSAYSIFEGGNIFGQVKRAKEFSCERWEVSASSAEH